MFVIEPGGEDEKKMEKMAAKAEKTALLRAEWAAQMTAQFETNHVT
jgi:hypothetical protein